MKRCLLSLALLLFVAALLTGCDLHSNSDVFTENDDDPVGDLIMDLRSTGADVERSGNVSQPFFSVEGHLLTVNSETVQVFAYATVDEANAEAAGISPDGSSFHREGSATIVTWIGPPHFYRRDALLVLYVGVSSEVVEALEEVLGSQFAARPPPKSVITPLSHRNGRELASPTT